MSLLGAEDVREADTQGCLGKAVEGVAEEGFSGAFSEQRVIHEDLEVMTD